MHVFEVVYGLIFVLLLVIKYSKGKTIARQAVFFFLLGLWILIGGAVIAGLVTLASPVGGVVLGAIAAGASGVMLVLGLQTELLPPDPNAPKPPPRPAAAARPGPARPPTPGAPAAPAAEREAQPYDEPDTEMGGRS